MGNSKLHQKKEKKWKCNSTHLSNQCVKGKIKNKLENILGQMKMKCQHINIYIL